MELSMAMNKHFVMVAIATAATVASILCLRSDMANAAESTIHCPMQSEGNPLRLVDVYYGDATAEYPEVLMPKEAEEKVNSGKFTWDLVRPNNNLPYSLICQYKAKSSFADKSKIAIPLPTSMTRCVEIHDQAYHRKGVTCH
jgi:hypothetical protein